MNVEKPQILPYDDEYVLVSKRRLAASNDCIAALAIQLSALTNNSQLYILKIFALASIRTINGWSQERLNKHIKEITSSDNQFPKKSA